MSFSRELGAPYTLVSLPRPFDTANGRTVVAGVHSLSGSKKRKRTEVAAGIDGEGVNIYSASLLNAPQLVTSYALPPHTKFTAPPCSVYRKGSTKRASQRFTYAPVAQSLDRSDAQIVCFVEDVQKGNAQAPRKSFFNIPKTTRDLIAIEVIPLMDTAETLSVDHDVITIHEGGEIFCLSADLKHTRWIGKVGELTGAHFGAGDKPILSVEHVSLTTAKAVRQGLLKSRVDVLAALDPSLGNQPDSFDATHILCLVAHSPKDQKRTLQIFAISPRSTDLITSRRPSIHHLLSWKLPGPNLAIPNSSKMPTYSLNSKSGVLHQLLHGMVTTYDFSGTLPRISSTLEVPQTFLQSFVRLSPSLLFASSEGMCGIFDVKYNSIHAICNLRSRTRALAGTKKRKIPSESSPGFVSGAIELVAYFTDINLVIGVSKEELVGFQLGVESATSIRKRDTEAPLIDSIGNGLRIKRQKPEPLKRHANPLERCIADFADCSGEIMSESRMNSHAAHGNVTGFERLFGPAVGLKPKPKPTSELKTSSKKGATERSKTSTSQKLFNGVKHETLTNGLGEHTTADSDAKDHINGSHDNTAPSPADWQLPASISDSDRHLYRREAIFALGKIFSWAPSTATDGERDDMSTQTDASSIVISFCPPKVFHWLLLSGHLTRQLIERALRGQSSKESHAARSITDGDIVTAIVQFDPELRLLLSTLSQATFFPITEVVQAIRLLVKSLGDVPASEPPQLLLTNGVSSGNENTKVDMDAEMEEATEALDHVQSLLKDGLDVRSQALQHAFSRLHTFPAPLATSTLRSCLTHYEIGSLINVLRIALRNGMWSTPYEVDSDIPEASDDAVYDHSIAIVVSLLTCALDAVGIGGWFAAINTPATDDSTDSLLKCLDTEVTETLTGVWEAVWIKGCISDFLRYAHKISKRPKHTLVGKPGKLRRPVLVPRRDDDDPDIRLVENLLPLGSDENAVIANTKIGTGGVVEMRSKREMGMLVSRRVPKYSIEQIVI